VDAVAIEVAIAVAIGEVTAAIAHIHPEGEEGQLASLYIL
jgi:hypothetical protein